jgi:two-component system chemotaxis sensor kinase CheA
VTIGDATELDKKLIDEIGDPLTHLIRNGIDHGMESPDERAQAGKVRQGTVQLEAFHQGSVICIKVSDDGRGLSVERIRNKAIERGLVTAEAAARMSHEEIYQFIFLPGFSTAAQVTNISGRGVGMDIVKSKVMALKGKIAISSDPGKGASFTISLPLTLAMIDSLLVKIGNDRFAFPLDCVREIVEVSADEVRTVEGKGRVIFLRDQVISLLDLNRVVGISPLSSTSGLVRAVITKGGAETLAIAVDQVIGDEEIVVKPLGQQFTKVRGLSGATVLGDGGIALILDIHGIHDLTHVRHTAMQHAGS